MGYIKHHAIVVTAWDQKRVAEANKKAKQIFAGKLVSEPICGLANDQWSFFIAPDGSKEGWEISDNADYSRKELLDYLHKSTSCDFIEVCFGGDDEIVITKTNDNYCCSK